MFKMVADLVVKIMFCLKLFQLKLVGVRFLTFVKALPKMEHLTAVGRTHRVALLHCEYLRIKLVSFEML